MSKKLLLIINPIAGKKRGVDCLPQVVSKFEESGFEVETRYTEIDKNATVITREYGSDKDIVACIGGDGTLKETICGVMELGLDCQIGYIPMGTTNDFAHSLHIPTDAVKAAEVIIKGKEMQIDIGDFDNKDKFIYVSCFGNFCNISYGTKQSLKNKLGRAAYYLSTVKEVPKLKSYKAKIECEDGEIIEGKFFYCGVSNSYSVAGFPVLTKSGVKFDDGLHELALIRMPKNPAQLASILNAMFITREVASNKYLVLRRGKKFKFYCDEEYEWSFDGEYGGKHKFAEITTKENAIRILVDD